MLLLFLESKKRVDIANGLLDSFFFGIFQKNFFNKNLQKKFHTLLLISLFFFHCNLYKYFLNIARIVSIEFVEKKRNNYNTKTAAVDMKVIIASEK